MKIWNQVKAKKPENLIQTRTKEAVLPASLYIYDIISEFLGVGANDVADALKDIDAEQLNVYINSPGGDIFEARAIASNLKRVSASGTKVVAVIDGICASAATSIALACDEVQMNKGCQFMIHEVSTCCYGNKRDLRACADLTEEVEKDIVADYVSKTGKSEDEIIAMMEAETWLSTERAVEHGFVDSIVCEKANNEESEKAIDPEEDDKPKKESVGNNSNANRLKLLLAQ